jgi:hypothetical protein
VDGTPQAISLQSLTLGKIAIEITKIREIRFKSDLGELESTPENDILYFRTGDSMTGVIDHLGKEYVQIQHAQLGSRKEYFDKLERIVLAQLEASPQPTENLSTILLGVDNTMLCGELSGVQNDELIFEVGYLNHHFAIPLRQIQRFFFINGRFTYISDLPARQYQMVYEHYVSGGSVDPFLPRLDQNQKKGPIRLNGQIFYKGLGVLSRTQIKISLEGKYRKFQSYIGIDDCVREGFEQNSSFPWIGGSVVFRVYVDGVSRFDSGIMRWFTPPKTVEVDITDKTSLLLEVDWAKEDSFGNANDYANWAGARLIK